jgi:hypothetical protein
MPQGTRRTATALNHRMHYERTKKRLLRRARRTSWASDQQHRFAVPLNSWTLDETAFLSHAGGVTGAQAARAAPSGLLTQCPGPRMEMGCEGVDDTCQGCPCWAGLLSRCIGCCCWCMVAMMVSRRCVTAAMLGRATGSCCQQAWTSSQTSRRILLGHWGLKRSGAFRGWEGSAPQQS